VAPDLADLPNVVSLPLSKKKAKHTSNFNEKYGWESCSFQLAQSNLITGRVVNPSKAEDTCLRCQKRGHCASECQEGHEPDWIAKQTCYLCGKVGHIKSGCPQNM
jgi:hypothetical protein